MIILLHSENGGNNMKKILSFVILGIVVIIAALGAYIFIPNEVEIPQEKVISAVKSKFPIEKSKFILGDLKLSNPEVYFENDKLVVETDYKFTGIEPAETINGKARFESELDYKKQDLYLWKFDLKKLTLNDGREVWPDKYALTILGEISNEFYNNNPIMNLGNNKKFASADNVKIRNKKVIVERKKAVKVF